MDMKKIRLTLIVAVLLGVFSYAYADVATLISPLTWRLDNSGAFSFPKAGNGVYAPNDFVATPGQISSITVNWEAEGEINFEVSADNGLHYYPVVNGLPLKAGFVSGNRLRWRATELSENAKLSSVKISYTDSSKVLGNFGEPVLSEFKYRKEISIKNLSGKVLYNYQMKFNIGENSQVKLADFDCAGRLQSDFKDIRFTANDRETALPYYMESLEGVSPKRLAAVWVKVPQIPKNGISIYLYYGKDKAEDLSDPEKTFDFFDDFKGKELDLIKWNVHPEQKGSYSVDNGKIKLDAAEIVTKEFKFKEGIVEYLCELGSGFENSLSVRETNIKSYDNPDWSAYSSIYKGAEHCVAVDNIVKADDTAAKPAVTGGQYNYRVNLEAGKVIFERFDSSFKELEASASYQITPEPKAGYLSLRSGGDGSGKNNIYFGPLRVRKTTSIPPSLEKVGSEEAVSLPVFSNTKLSNKGKIILSPGTSEGYYISEGIYSPFDINVLILKWEVLFDKNLSVGFSTDRGASYKKPCEKGRFFYSSKRDFSASTNLKFRLDLSGGNDPSGGISQFSLDYRPGKVNLIAPNGKEEWGAGTKKKIMWSALDYELIFPFEISYSTDKGKTFIDIIQDKENDGKFIWTVPNDLSNSVKIKISNSLDKSNYDISDSYFSIVANETAQDLEQDQLAEEVALVQVEDVEDADKKEITGSKLRPDTRLYDVLIKVGDNHSPDPEEDAKACYKNGDVVRVEPAGHIWGADERTNFLIIQLYLTENEVQALIKPKQITTGRLDASGRPIMEQAARKRYKLDLDKLGMSKKTLPQMRQILRGKSSSANIIEK